MEKYQTEMAEIPNAMLTRGNIALLIFCFHIVKPTLQIIYVRENPNSQQNFVIWVQILQWFISCTPLQNIIGIFDISTLDIQHL